MHSILYNKSKGARTGLAKTPDTPTGRTKSHKEVPIWRNQNVFHSAAVLRYDNEANS